MSNSNHKFPPLELMTTARWIVADKTKKPIPGTAAADREFWRSYDSCLAAVSNGEAAFLGFSLFGGVDQAGYRLVVVDLDSCFDAEGELLHWARDIVEYYDSYTEKSPSGTGLHVFVNVLLENADYPASKHYIGGKPKGSEPIKAPQVQVIGGNCAGYVTVTGDMIEGVQDRIVKVSDLHWLRAVFPPGDGGADIDLKKVQLESSWTDEKGVTMAEIADRVRRRGHDAELLLRGSWTSVRTVDDIQHYPSASEAYFALVHHVLKCCSRDGELAVEFMLSPHCGAWAAGEVEHSVEPEKYALEEWVRNRVKKATAVTSEERPDFLAADLFGDAAEPEEEPAEQPDLGILQPSDFRLLYGKGDPWLLKGLLPAIGVVQFYGRPKNGKSLVTMALAAAVASGAEHCFGQRLFKSGPVLILVGEDHHGVAHRTLAQELVSQVGASAGYAELAVYLTTHPGNLSTVEGLERLKAQIDAVGPVMILVDTQIANAGALDENDTKEMGAFMGRIERISLYGKGCLVGLVHHTAKSGKGGARGSGVQGGAVVADFEVLTSNGRVRLIPRNAKNWPSMPELSLHVEAPEVGKDADGEPITSPAIDFRVHPNAAAAGLPVEPEVKPETKVPAPAGAEEPAVALILYSLEHGRQPRPAVAEYMAKQGFLGAGTANALRYLERKLVDQGALTVDASQSRTAPGVAYKAGKRV